MTFNSCVRTCTKLNSVPLHVTRKTVPSVQNDVKMAICQATANVSKTEDLQNRLRKYNVRIVSICEKSKGFIEKWVIDIIVK